MRRVSPLSGVLLGVEQKMNPNWVNTAVTQYAVAPHVIDSWSYRHCSMCDGVAPVGTSRVQGLESSKLPSGMYAG